MIEKYVQWLRKNNVDKLGNLNMDQYALLSENSCVGYANTDKEGRPVYIERVCKLNADIIFQNYSD